MKCENCAFYYQTENEEYPTCHCDLPNGQAPCEVDEPDDYYDEAAEDEPEMTWEEYCGEEKEEK